MIRRSASGSGKWLARQGSSTQSQQLPRTAGFGFCETVSAACCYLESSWRSNPGATFILVTDMETHRSQRITCPITSQLAFRHTTGLVAVDRACIKQPSFPTVPGDFNTMAISSGLFHYIWIPFCERTRPLYLGTASLWDDNIFTT
jgi:hypothetical protein